MPILPSTKLLDFAMLFKGAYSLHTPFLELVKLICHTALSLVSLVMCLATIGLVTFSAALVPCHTPNEIHHFVIENITPFFNGNSHEVIQL